MDDAVGRYARAARRMGCDIGAVRVSSTDQRQRGETGRWVWVNDKKFWVPEAYALMESPTPQRTPEEKAAAHAQHYGMGSQRFIDYLKEKK